MILYRRHIQGSQTMELSWPMRLRIAAAAATGAVLIGILAWPLAKPDDPFGVVSLVAGTISLGDATTLASLAFLTGLAAYFICWPYGREIATLAAPSGLALWALRTGDMADLMQLNPTLPQRQAIFVTLKWEPFFWLAIVAAGLAGTLLAQKISQPKSRPNKPEQKPISIPYKYLSASVALVGSVLVVQLCIRILAQDVRIFDSKLGSVVAQPAVGQIVFAVLVSFGVAAFIFKKFLDVSYIWPTIASGFVTAFVNITYVNTDVLQHLVGRYPAVFFSNAVISILPVQMVAFGTLGAIAGYWMAIRYTYWRKHESK
jgi:hypothetical protein